MKMKSLLWHHVYVEHSQSVHCQFFYHLPSVKHHCQLRVPEKWTRSAMKRLKMSHINIFFNISSKFIYTLIDTHWSDHMRDSSQLTAVITASAVKTTHRPGLFHQQHFLVHKWTSYTKHVSLVLQLLLQYAGCISEWVAFGQNAFVHRKWITERCFLEAAFNGNIVIFIIYISHHSDVIVIKFRAVTQN